MYENLLKKVVLTLVLFDIGILAHSQHPDSLSLSLEEMLSGSCAGMQITKWDHSPSAPFNILIRGIKAIRGNNEPLIVLDGIPLTGRSKTALNTFLYDDTDSQMCQNSLYVINPQDIESIEILKDAASAALYGGEGGAGGVIRIWTKKGGRGNQNIFWKSDVGISTMANPNAYDMLDGKSYSNYIRNVNPASNIPGSDYLPVNWQKEAFRPAFSHSHYLSAGGGSRSTEYFMSAKFDDTDGIIANSGSTSGTFRLNISNSLGRVGTMGVNSLFSLSTTDMVRSSTMAGASGTIDRIISGRPILTSFDFDKLESGVQDDMISENYYSFRDDYDDHSKKYRVFTSLFVNLDITRNLKWENTFGVDFYDEERRRWFGNMTVQGYDRNSISGVSTHKGMSYFGTTHFVFSKKINSSHFMSAKLGMTASGDKWLDNVAEGYSFSLKYLRGIKDAQLFPDGKGGVRTTPLYNMYRSSSLLLAGDISLAYVIKDKYSLSASVRSDVQTKYTGKDDIRWYPSGRFSWNILKEPWGLDTVLSEFNLDLKYGRSGISSVDLFKKLSLYYPDTIAMPESILMDEALRYSIFWNLINEEYDASLRLGLCEGRINMSLGYYHSRAFDNLGVYTKGYSGKADLIEGTRTSATVSNCGVEFSLASDLIKTKDILWNLGLNFSYNKNEIKNNGYESVVRGNPVGRMADGTPLLRSGAFVNGATAGAIYGYKSAGIVTAENIAYAPAIDGTRLQEGDIMLVDYDGDMNVTEADMTVIGNAVPKYLANLNMSLTYKNWRFDVYFSGAFDYNLLNLNKMKNDYFVSGNLDNISESRYKAWASGSDVPRLDALGQDVISDRFVENASYVKLSKLRVTYRQPITTKWIKDISFSLSAYNLFTITGYSGYDPSVNSFGGDISRYGVDSRAYPSARSVVLSVFANF